MRIEPLAQKRTAGVARTVPYRENVRDVAVHCHVARKERWGKAV